MKNEKYVVEICNESENTCQVNYVLIYLQINFQRSSKIETESSGKCGYLGQLRKKLKTSS